MVCSTTVLSNSEEICLYHDESGLNVLGCRTIFSRKASKDEGLLDSLPSGVLWMCVSEREYFGVDIQRTFTFSLNFRVLRPVVKLQNNRGNNKYSYTSNSDDNLLKNIELFDKLVLRFNGRVLFVKDVLGDEICCWSFYGEGRKIAEVCCTSIVYATEKKQTKVEFPEARIFKETLNILIYENNRGSGPGGLHLLDSRGSGSSLGTGQSEEEGAVGGDRRVRRIHVRRHIMHDERGHGQQTVYKD
ncbi:BTB/POZ domain-containing adapter for CUL3-mediated RhoA degradation protein 1 [Oreochromis niloticus]|uniref:BTB/POZ domain-containing adapter for CUL3-mediated RhoA degradation protein 1 n=2 Tax=Oreochromis niloticus TaxID=8128 RepID=UPI000DF3F948|nr:BTB/POZ domain-containing adapter for CUL3-mediated RhoA degradation protein 1-like [Oreochromis niloticus]XP_025762432.1 BTB/POZ domain-containing adapter for CUL3-mediated RhoA degradation protein 1 [Oreochromis niloticus]